MATCYEEHQNTIETLVKFYQDNAIKMMFFKGYGYWSITNHRPVEEINIYLGHLW